MYSHTFLDVKRFRFRTWISLFACFFVLFDLLSLSECNNDWQGYEDAYNQVYEAEGDIGYYGLNAICFNLGINYGDFYTFFQALTDLLLLIGFARLSDKGWHILLPMLLLMISPNLPILIRYYFAFALLLNALPFYIKKNYVKFGILCLVSFSFHSGLVLFIPVFLLYRIKKTNTEQQYISKLLKYSLFVAIGKESVLAFLKLVGLNVFGLYADQGAQWMSSIYFDVMYFMWFCYCYYVHCKVVSHSPKVLKNDKTYSSLYYFIHYPLLFLFVSDIQIVGIRIFEPILIICVAYLFYSAKYITNRKLHLTAMCFLLLLLSSLMKYYFLGLITGMSQWTIYYTEILISNTRSLLLNMF